MSHADRWDTRTLEHVRVLSKGIGARAATGAEERRAAEYVRDELKRLGVSHVRLESFQGAASTWLPWSIAFSLAVWGMLIAVFLDSIGGIVAAGLNLLGAWIVYRELYPPTGLDRGLSASGYPIRRWLWHGDSQNVLGIVPPTGTVERQVVLLSYLDSTVTPFLWRNRRRRRLAGCLIPFLFLSLLVSAVVIPLATLTSNVLLSLLALLMLFPQTAALLFAIRSEHSPVSPGANNNASGVGTLLALAERLKATPLTHTEAWLLATGCRETGGDGIRAFLKNHNETLTDSTFVALEGVGVGEQVVYLTGEGILRKTPYSPEALTFAERAAEHCRELEIPVRAEFHPGGPTEIGIIARNGLRGTTINAWPIDQPGVLGRRQMDDTFDTVQKKALTQVQTFVWALLHEIDK